MRVHTRRAAANRLIFRCLEVTGNWLAFLLIKRASRINQNAADSRRSVVSIIAA
jgi:hypothetical protein